ncbi:MAG: hypothetical protein FWE41_03450 [Coriobacteriia bacterium]|nr:hypothetical protein [Coriobacteriia bacterium]MCL2749715.1 hypothetical protein [Coriobacteriia bacterium]
MDTNEEHLRKQEEAVALRYRQDCKLIEDKQDAIKEQQRIFQDIEESLLASVRQTDRLLQEHTNTSDAGNYHLITEFQSSLFSSYGDASRSITQHQEDLIVEGRKLSRERDERDKEFQEELRKHGDNED